MTAPQWQRAIANVVAQTARSWSAGAGLRRLYGWAICESPLCRSRRPRDQGRGVRRRSDARSATWLIPGGRSAARRVSRSISSRRRVAASCSGSGAPGRRGPSQSACRRDGAAGRRAGSSCSAINPRLIYCHSSGYGNDGAVGEAADLRAAAFRDHRDARADRRRGQLPDHYLTHMDYGCGLTSCAMVFAALVEREHSGVGPISGSAANRRGFVRDVGRARHARAQVGNLPARSRSTWPRADQRALSNRGRLDRDRLLQRSRMGWRAPGARLQRCTRVCNQRSSLEGI